MREIRLFALITLLPVLANAQYFSGEITYQTTIIPKSDTVDVSLIMDQQNGTKASYLITSTRYKSTYYKNDQYQYSYTYDDVTKRMYDDYREKPYVTFRDSRKTESEYLGSTIYKDSTVKILNYDCFLVETKSSQSTSRTFYSTDLKFDYSSFEGHQVGNWYQRTKEVNGSVMLKTINKLEQYTEILEAIGSDKRKVKPKEFDLPDKPIAASYQALDQQVSLKPPTEEQIQCYQQKVNSVSNPQGEKYTSYISFLLQADGQIKFVSSYEEDEEGLYNTAIEIVESCGLEFQPGLIAGTAVNAEVYFPVEFLK